MSSDSQTAEVFTLDLPVTESVAVQDAMGNGWKIAGRIYKLAQNKLNELVATKLPPRDDVLLAAEEAFDKYVSKLEAAAKELFVESVGRLYDSIAGVVKS